MVKNWSSILVAVMILATAAIWMLGGEHLVIRQASLAQPPDQGSIMQDPPISVATQTLTAWPYTPNLEVKGISQANRSVTLRTRTSGTMMVNYAEQGDFVESGDWIARLSEDTRPARLKAAFSTVQQSEEALTMALKFGFDGASDEFRLAEAEIDLASARAEYEAARLDLGYTELKAPFDGFIETMLVEVGDVVETGDAIALLIDLDPLRGVAYLGEQHLHHIKPGLPARFRSETGLERSGEIKFIAPKATPGHGKFQIDILLENTDHSLRAGQTGTISIDLAPIQAFTIPPELLTQDADGSFSVMVIDEDGRSQLMAVTLLDQDDAGQQIIKAKSKVLTIIDPENRFLPVGAKVVPVDKAQ
ncbi:MAG: efflux RND transporter periplasmic adaptor subunit [Pseudomonadota bacterium]